MAGEWAMTDELRRDLRESLAKLHRYHLVVEDCWYSCTAAGENYCGPIEDGRCDCGAEQQNAEIDRLLGLLGDP